MNLALHLLFLIGLYVPLAYSLNLVLGYGGLASFCHAAFYGIGAYSYALLMTVLALPAAAALGGSVLLTGAAALCIGFIALRFRGDLFLFVTLAVQMIVFLVLYNWIEVTNGPYGISAIPRPSILGLSLSTPADFVAAALVMNAAAIAILFAIYASPFAAVLKAIREDETAAAALGISANLALLKGLVLSAMIAAVPGALLAGYVTYIGPTSFSLKESIFQVAILLLGGSGNRRGPFIGVVLMILIPEGLRFAGALPDNIAPNLREIIYGALLVGLMYFRPRGIAGEFAVR